MNALTGFQTYNLMPDFEPFSALSLAVDFEDIAKGRRGNHLVNPDEQWVPIVRTTTQYTKAPHCFLPEHNKLLKSIQSLLPTHAGAQHALVPFNHALIEIYDQNYFKMGYHSDQALDLEDASFIALYSCYERPESRDLLRTLQIKSRTTGEESSILLEHNMVVLFSLETNRQYLHKIVLRHRPSTASTLVENRWLGITFRQSKTLIRFDGQYPEFTDGRELMLANDVQRRQFYQLRGQENRDMDFDYPQLDFTINEADLMMPI